MQVTVESTSDLGRKLSIVVPAEKIEEQVSQKLQELSKQVKLDGFRPGKVPASVVKQRFGEGARSEVIGHVLQNSLYEAITEKELNPAGMPEIDSIKSEAGQPLEYTAIFEVYPEIALTDFSSITAEKITAEVTDADVTEMLDSIRKQRTEWEVVERASENDDKLKIDFEGFKDDVAFEGGKAENADLVLGSKSFIPGFEDGLIGKKAGDDVVLDLTFPEEYQAKDLAGQKVKFNVTVKEVNAPKLPELNEDFAKAMGVESGDIEAFKTQVREHMNRELEQTIKSKQKQHLFEQLLNEHKFEVPAALIQNEVTAIMKQYMPKHEPTKEQIDAAPEELKTEAKRRVSIGLVVAEIIKKQDIKVDQDKVKDYVEDMAKSYEQPQQMVAWYYGDKQRMAGIEAVVLEEQVFDKICEAAKVEDKKLSYSEVMKADQEQ